MRWASGQRLLIYGIGNLGRQDDGLGIRAVQAIEKEALAHGVAVEANYQLNVEDALLISEFDQVLFIDAALDKSSSAPFEVKKLEPKLEFAFTSHSLDPAAVLALCSQLYQKEPRTFLMKIPGYEWGIGEELSPQARENLKQTIRAIQEDLRPSTASPSL